MRNRTEHGYRNAVGAFLDKQIPALQISDVPPIKLRRPIKHKFTSRKLAVKRRRTPNLPWNLKGISHWPLSFIYSDTSFSSVWYRRGEMLVQLCFSASCVIFPKGVRLFLDITTWSLLSAVTEKLMHIPETLRPQLFTALSCPAYSTMRFFIQQDIFLTGRFIPVWHVEFSCKPCYKSHISCP
jgi:hypothetical protein